MAKKDGSLIKKKANVASKVTKAHMTKKKKKTPDNLKKSMQNGGQKAKQQHVTSQKRGSPTNTTTLNDDDWMSSLVKKTVKMDSNGSSNSLLQTSKEERIRKRQSKKQQKVDSSSKRRRHIKEERNITTSKGEEDERETQETKNDMMNGIESKVRHQNEVLQRERMERLEQQLKEIVTRFSSSSSPTLKHSDHSRPSLDDPYKNQQQMNGKAVHGRGSGLTQTLLMPRNCDYGGCGLARSSLYIDLFDPSFIPKVEEEFAEHIDGFKTKMISKSMKKQLDGNMLWRQLQRSKQQQETELPPSQKQGSGATMKTKQGKVVQHGQKLSNMNPDDRVEAMIKLGLI